MSELTSTQVMVLENLSYCGNRDEDGGLGLRYDGQVNEAGSFYLGES